MDLISPLSTEHGRQYKDALPQFSEEESKKGHISYVGYSVSYLVYRSSWDDKLHRTNWNYLYSGGTMYEQMLAGLRIYP